MKDVGRKIRQLREEKGLTQEQLAHMVGYKSRVSINKIELQRDIPINKIVPIAKALDVDPHILLGWEEENTYMDLPDGRIGKVTSIEDLLLNPKEVEDFVKGNGRILVPIDEKERLANITFALESLSKLSPEDRELVIKLVQKK